MSSDIGAPDIAIPVSGLVALAFGATFVFGDRLRPAMERVVNHRSAISFAAGTSVAYVFVQLVPEMHETRTAFVEAIGMPLPFEGKGLYLMALLGFLVFYGLDHFGARRQQSGEAGGPKTSFGLHIGGFAVYVWLMSYLLVRNPAPTIADLALSALATALHFLSIDHSLREEHDARYVHLGRFLLAGGSLSGWAAGLAAAVPDSALLVLLSFIAGAVIVNSMIMELPSEKDGRLFPFLIGGLSYGALLVLHG